MLLPQRIQDAAVVLLDRRSGPRGDGPLIEGEVLVGDDQFGIRVQQRAEAGAVRARTPRAVEGELAGLELVDVDVVLVGAAHLLGEAALAFRVLRIAVDEVDGDDAAGKRQGRLDGFGDALLGVGPHDSAVDDGVDVVLVGLGDRGEVGQRIGLAVDPDAGVAIPRELAEEFGVLALAATHERGEDLEAGALLLAHQPVDDLLRRLLADDRATHLAVRDADAGVEEAEVVVDLGDGAHCRARVARGGLLVDRHRGREALDEVDVRLVHLPQEHAGVGGQRLHVAPLALGEDRVECQ